MVGRLYIDNIDAYTRYGVLVEQYGLNGVIQMPSFKALDKTEWDEYDGEEVDLTAPILDSKNFSIKFCILNIENAEELFYALSDGAYHTFEFAEIGKCYQLRMTSNGSFSSLTKLGKLTLSFVDDFPVVPEGDYYQYGQSGVCQFGYSLDGIDLSQFGCFVLEGSDDAIRKAPDVRENLTINSKAVAGKIYDSEVVHFKSKSVSLKLLINTKDVNEFWRRWNSLWAILLQPELHIFSALGYKYECYYDSNNVSQFVILKNGHIWCEFDLTLVFLDKIDYTILITEDGKMITTEDESIIIIR